MKIIKIIINCIKFKILLLEGPEAVATRLLGDFPTSSCVSNLKLEENSTLPNFINKLKTISSEEDRMKDGRDVHISDLKNISFSSTSVLDLFTYFKNAFWPCLDERNKRKFLLHINKENIISKKYKYK